MSSIARQDARNYITPEGFIERNINFFITPKWQTYECVVPDADLTSKWAAVERLMSLDSSKWTADALAHEMRTMVNEATNHDSSPSIDSKTYAVEWNKEFYHCLRWILVDGRQGPGLGHTMAILGRDVCNDRLKACQKILKVKA